MKALIFILTALLTCSSFQKHQKSENYTSNIVCMADSCYGYYEGPEFINGDDIAHQFSNSMSTKVGNQLKKLYSEKTYVKVNLKEIKMSTIGMGTGKVRYELGIPFITVFDSCKARTSFDHCGGWNHTPALKERKKRLETILLPGDKLEISKLTKTPEGLQEYWIQWRNIKTQQSCAKQKTQ